MPYILNQLFPGTRVEYGKKGGGPAVSLYPMVWTVNNQPRRHPTKTVHSACFVFLAVADMPVAFC